MNDVACIDAIQFINSLKGRPDLILTDPPYGISYSSNIAGDKKWNKTGVTLAERRGLKGKFSPLLNDAPGKIDFKTFFNSCYKNSSEDAWLLVFAGWAAQYEWVPLIIESGFKLRPTIFWNKRCANGGNLKDGIIPTVEVIIRAVKGNPKCQPIYNDKNLIRKRVVSLWDFGRVPRSEYCGHPTQKPLNLVSRLISMSTTEGQYVVDPFCGSGTTLVAAKSLNRQFDGADIDSDFVNISKQRLL